MDRYRKSSVVIRLATSNDVAAISDTYTHLIHTLCIPPEKASKGYATQMLDFAKSFAKNHGCKVIRIDTYAENNPAKKLYVNNGFEIAGYGNIVLQGLIPEAQVYLECFLG